jgi:ribonuclease HII
MTRLGERYPGYGFERHKGYGTKVHMAAIGTTCAQAPRVQM